ncbi:MAG: hypothetical protein HQ562_00685 [Candidatus Marinimicrobia bacterium]|nr:hypothetical protein [Candidatus Neomarinimicrobiota bacterium]
MNIYFLLSALLLLLLAFAHAWWGEKKVFPRIRKVDLTASTYLSVYVPWHQLTWVLALSAFFLFLAAFWKEGLISLVFFILLVLIGNLIIFTVLCLKRGEVKLITKSVPQYILFGLTIVLILIGLFQG